MLEKRVPKYGNDVKWVDDLGAKWAGYFRNRMKDYTNYRGGPYHTGMYTVSGHVPMGKTSAPLPMDGKPGSHWQMAACHRCMAGT